VTRIPRCHSSLTPPSPRGVPSSPLYITLRDSLIPTRKSMLQPKHTSLSVSYQTDASVEEEKPPLPCVCVCVCIYVYVYVYINKYQGGPSHRDPD
jgi:hypothetical protein